MDGPFGNAPNIPLGAFRETTLIFVNFIIGWQTGVRYQELVLTFPVANRNDLEESPSLFTVLVVLGLDSRTSSALSKHGTTTELLHP